jgi:hypothetical protein
MTEIFTVPTYHDCPQVFVRRKRIHMIGQLLHHCMRDDIAAPGPVQSQIRKRPVPFDQDRFRHRFLSPSFPQTD